MENLNENTKIPKQRHGCVTAWLTLMIFANSLVVILYLLNGDMVAQNSPSGISSSMLTLLILLGTGNVLFSVLLFKWKKVGFWGLIFTSTGALIINISSELGIGQSLFGLLGIVILYGVLQIKKDNVSAWNNLE